MYRIRMLLLSFVTAIAVAFGLSAGATSAVAATLQPKAKVVATAKAQPKPSTKAAAPAPATAGTVKYGSKGALALEVQTLLKKAGFNPGPLDGDFRARSEKALKAYQTANGLRADGVAGQLSLAKLRGQKAAKPGQPAVPASTSGLGVTYGSRGAGVAHVQDRLRYHRDSWGNPFYGRWSNGIADDAFMNALIGFQRDKGLYDSGTVTVETLAELNSNSRWHAHTDIPEHPNKGFVLVTSISQRKTWAFQDGVLVRGPMRSRTGGWNTQQHKFKPDFGQKKVFRTPTGKFTIYAKDKVGDSPTYGKNSMPNSVFFARGDRYHYSEGFVKNGFYGSSHECINLDEADSEFVYNHSVVGKTKSVVAP